MALTNKEELENPSAAKPAEDKGFDADRLGQRYPRQCPPQGAPIAAMATSPLGPPLNIRQVAAMLGCSAWTVRNAWIPRGLPHFRSGPNGRLTFFQNQVIRFVERQQQGGRNK